MQKRRVVVFLVMIALVMSVFVGCDQSSGGVPEVKETENEGAKTEETEAEAEAEEKAEEKAVIDDSDKKEVKAIMQRKFASGENFQVDFVLKDSFKDTASLKEAQKEFGLDSLEETKEYLKENFKNSKGAEMLPKSNEQAKLDTLILEPNEDSESITASLEFKEGDVREFDFEMNKSGEWYMVKDLPGLVDYIKSLEN